MANLGLEYAARFAEVRLHAHLWWQEEYLQLFTPTNYVDQGEGRLWVYGPSEAREAFLPEVLDEKLPGLATYQNAQSIGAIEDGLVVLDYMEQVHGSSAAPDVLALGISTRFMANIRPVASPLYAAINKYSPHFRLDESTSPPILFAKSFGASMQSRFAFLTHQKRRYRAAIKAIMREPLVWLLPKFQDNQRLLRGLRPSKYHGKKPWPDKNKIAWLETPGSFWEDVHAWDPAADRQQIIDQLQAWSDFAARHNAELYVINMPEFSRNRAMYPPGRYEAYLEAVKAGLGDVPFLNLREFLADEDFYDSCHPTLNGSVKFSHRVAAFIAEHRKGQRPQ